MHDPVNKPKHYQIRDNLEVIDVRDSLLDNLPETVGFREADYWSRSWEYLTRAFHKDGLQDLKKARWYLDRLIKTLEK